MSVLGSATRQAIQQARQQRERDEIRDEALRAEQTPAGTGASFAYVDTQDAAALAAAEAYTDAAIAALPASSSDGGITIQGGSVELVSALDVGFTVSGICPADYAITDWDLWVYPSGSLTLDVRKCAFAALPPVGGDSISAAADPAVVGDISASGDTTGWSGTTINKTDAISVVVMAISGVKWFSLLLKGTKS